MHSDQPVTLYIVTEPVDKARLQPLVRVLVNMIVRISASGLAFEKRHTETRLQASLASTSRRVSRAR
jgi:hypothetical protein